MDKTSLTLLDSLRTGDQQAWQRFDRLYRPFLQQWLIRHGVSAADGDDLCQSVMLISLRELPRFQHAGRTGSFRKWLRTILAHECGRQAQRRNRAKWVELSDNLSGDDSELTQQWDREHDASLINQLIALVKPNFSEQSWRAFELVKLQDKTPEQAALELGMPKNAIYIACSRVLARFRTEGGEFLD